MKELSSVEQWRTNGVRDVGCSKMFQTPAQHLGLKLPAAVKEARHAAERPKLPTPEQLAALAGIVGDKDWLFREYEQKVAKHDARLKLTSVEKALRRAMHIYFMACNELKAASALDAIDVAIRYHDWETAHILHNKFNLQQMEDEAWRFYKDKADDALRQHLRAELKANGVPKVEFKSDWGLPRALKKWRLAEMGDTKRTADRWWNDRWRPDGKYHAVYQFEVEAYLKWRIADHRKKNAAGVASFRKKTVPNT